MESIARRYRKAKKEHICELCGNTISVGEKYCYQFNKDGSDVWSFKSHLECDFLCNELWYYIDPWDGMTEDEFIDGVRDFCRHMICPKCPKWNTTCYECTDDNDFCTEECVKVLKEYDFTTVKCDLPEARGRRAWGLVPKEHPVTELPRRF